MLRSELRNANSTVKDGCECCSLASDVVVTQYVLAAGVAIGWPRGRESCIVQAKKQEPDDQNMEEDAVDPLQQLAAIREAAEERQSQFEDNQGGPGTTNDGGKIGALHITEYCILVPRFHASVAHRGECMPSNLAHSVH